MTSTNVDLVRSLFAAWGAGTTARRSGHILLFRLRGREVTRLVVYFQRDRALADLGRK